jgi:hypothetical protein
MRRFYRELTEKDSPEALLSKEHQIYRDSIRSKMG